MTDTNTYKPDIPVSQVQEKNFPSTSPKFPEHKKFHCQAQEKNFSSTRNFVPKHEKFCSQVSPIQNKKNREALQPVFRQPVPAAPVCRIGHAEGGLQPLQTKHTRIHPVRYLSNVTPSLKTIATWNMEITGIALKAAQDVWIGFALNGKGSKKNRIFNSICIEQFK